MQKILQNRVFGVGQRDGRPGVFYAVGRKVDLQVLHGERSLGLAAVFLIAPQQRADLGQQLVVRKGLRQKIVAAAAISGEPVLLRGLRREEEHRGVGESAQRVAGLPTGHAGHHHVQDDKIDIGVLLYRADGGGAVLGFGDVVILAQQEPEHLADIGVVVDDQDMRSGGHVWITSCAHYTIKTAGNNCESHL